MRLCLWAVACLLVILVGRASAQEFAVASIKPAAPLGPFMFGIRPMPGGRINATNVTLKLLIEIAYGLEDFQLIGGEGWIETALYNIEAKPDSPVGPNEWKEMLRNLLADRFQLAFHRETKELPVSRSSPVACNQARGTTTNWC